MSGAWFLVVFLSFMAITQINGNEGAFHFSAAAAVVSVMLIFLERKASAFRSGGRSHLQRPDGVRPDCDDTFGVDYTSASSGVKKRTEATYNADTLQVSFSKKGTELK